VDKPYSTSLCNGITANNIKKGNKKTEEVIQDVGNFFSWPEKNDVKKFIQSNKKYVEFRDFLSLVFYNPRNLKI